MRTNCFKMWWLNWSKIHCLTSHPHLSSWRRHQQPCKSLLAISYIIILINLCPSVPLMPTPVHPTLSPPACWAARSPSSLPPNYPPANPISCLCLPVRPPACPRSSVHTTSTLPLHPHDCCPPNGLPTCSFLLSSIYQLLIHPITHQCF